MRTWSLRILRQISLLALSLLHLLAAAAAASFKSRTALQLENLALRHQLGVLRRSVKRPKLITADRLLWAWLSQVWVDWRSSLLILKPETVIGWHRKGFREVAGGCGFRDQFPVQPRNFVLSYRNRPDLWQEMFLGGDFPEDHLFAKLNSSVREAGVNPLRVLAAYISLSPS